MKKSLQNITLPEGNFLAKVIEIEKKDFKVIGYAYDLWRNLDRTLKKIDTRGVNLHTGISENAFCYFMPNCVRVTSKIPNANTSWDCYDLKRKKRIQVKAASINPDLSSFGPDSQWDEIYFMDFYKDGKWNGEFDIYYIKNNNWIYDCVVNKGKEETFLNQQKQGRRPRFSIMKEIIVPHKVKPIKKCNLKLL